MKREHLQRERESKRGILFFLDSRGEFGLKRSQSFSKVQMKCIHQTPQVLEPHYTLEERRKDSLQNQIRTVPGPEGGSCTEGLLRVWVKTVQSRISFCKPKTAELIQHPLAGRLQGANCRMLRLWGALLAWDPIQTGRRSQQGKLGLRR